jgi:hypothetical protein
LGVVSEEQKPLRFLFFMLHAGFIRFYRRPIELLAERGHEVHLAFTRIEKDPGDRRLAEELAASSPRITFGEAPLRRRNDGWRPLAALVRSFVDLGRYVDPRYADSPALRRRMAQKFADHAGTARRIDPFSSWLTRRVIHFMDARSSERLSRRIVRSLGTVERAIPTSERVDAYLRERRPDAVLVTPVIEFASTQVEYLKSARKAGIPSGVAVASWDNLTGKGLIRIVPDRVFVWNELQVDEAVEMHGIPRERVAVTGAPKFDEWFERAPRTDRAAFAAKVGLDPGGPFVVYACSSPFITPDEVSFVRRWLDALRADERLAGLGLLVRPHPQNAAQWDGVDLSEHGNVAIWPPHGAQPDAGDARADFFDSLAHSAAVVGINTSALIEAAIVGRSVLAPAADEFAGTQAGTLHFRYLLFENGGFVHVGVTLDEHRDQLAAVLERGDEHAEQTRRFIESFVRPLGLDRPAAPILADAFEALGRSAAQPSHRSVGDRALRILLTPAAAAVSVVGGIAGRLRKAPPAAEIA